MSETLKRINRLPKTIKNPFKHPSTEQKAVGILASLNALPEFREDIDGLTDVINVVKTPPVTQNQSQDLGHPTQDLEKTLGLLESRIHLGQLQEVTASRYLDALRFQRELSLQRPPSLAQRLGSSIIHTPVVQGATVAVLTSFPVGLIIPYASIEDYLFRAGIATVGVTAYCMFRNRRI